MIGSDQENTKGAEVIQPEKAKPPYLTRLLKGGALLEDMRLLVRAWTNNASDEQKAKLIIENRLGKKTRTRSADVFRRVFAPRFLHGNPPQSWKIVRPLENREVAMEISTPLYYWITARSDKLIYDFVSKELRAKVGSADPVVRTDEATNWIRRTLNRNDLKWSDAAIIKVARGLLAALRDFGILEGATIKRIAPRYLPTESFAYIAFALYQLGSSGIELQNHKDWELFLLSQPVVEQLFLDAHQMHFLRYEAAGSIVRIEFNATKYEEMADVITS